LLGIDKSKLAMMQKDLLEQGNTKDYYVFESVLKGNYLLKNQWKGDLKSGKEPAKMVGGFNEISGLTVRNFNP
jgi:hypothetical protein